MNDRIVTFCREIWEVVRGVLCYDSPEGFTLEEDENNAIDVGTKDTVSFSWRALKESRFALHDTHFITLLIFR